MGDFFTRLGYDLSVQVLAVLMVALGASAYAALRPRLAGWLETSRWRDVLLVFIGTFTFLLFTLNQIDITQSRWQRQRLHRPQYLEMTIREWFLDWGYSIGPPVRTSHMHFEFEVTDRDFQRFRISQTKEVGQFIIVGTTMEIPASEWAKVLDPITNRRFSPLISELRIELNRLGLEHAGVRGPLREVTMQTRLPVEELTEYRLVRAFHSIRQAIALVKEILFKYAETRPP